MIVGATIHGYGILQPLFALIAVSYVLLIPFTGFAITRIPNDAIARIFSWCHAFFNVTLVERVSSMEPSGTRMLFIIVALLWSMKAVVAVESKIHKGTRLNFWQWLCFVLFWFGMRPALFEALPGNPKLDWRKYFRRGKIQLFCGISIYFVAKHIWLQNNQGDSTREIAHSSLFIDLTNPAKLAWTILLMIAFSLVVHFGLFNLLVAWWRIRGLNCTSLFRAPLYSTSLTEFWGRRWNLAFSEMTSIAIFRPLNKLIGARSAMIVAFMFSGLLHELAISVPAKSGYGLPTIYFTLHALAMNLELQRGFGWLKNSVAGRVWTLAWIILPLPLLFHRPFLEGCVWPLFGR